MNIVFGPIRPTHAKVSQNADSDFHGGNEGSNPSGDAIYFTLIDNLF